MSERVLKCGVAVTASSWSMASPCGRSRCLVVLLAEADTTALKGAGKERRLVLERAGKERCDALAWEKQPCRAYTSRQRLPIPIASERAREEEGKEGERKRGEGSDGGVGDCPTQVCPSRVRPPVRVTLLRAATPPFDHETLIIRSVHDSGPSATKSHSIRREPRPTPALSASAIDSGPATLLCSTRLPGISSPLLSSATRYGSALPPPSSSTLPPPRSHALLLPVLLCCTLLYLLCSFLLFIVCKV